MPQDAGTENQFLRIETSLAATNATLDRLAARQDKSAEDAERWRTDFAAAAELLRRQQEENAHQIAENTSQIAELAKATGNLQKQWEAYLRRQPPQ